MISENFSKDFLNFVKQTDLIFDLMFYRSTRLVASWKNITIVKHIGLIHKSNMKTRIQKKLALIT